ncbi:MAG: hypothetical protein KDA65_08295 [Planctomycetaceae bacterium]|nr:hypothetical protein [Planctomycetaceae bacterium]
MVSRLFSLLLVVGVFNIPLQAEVPATPQPVALQEVAALIDFSTFPLFGSEPQAQRQKLASQFYQTKGTVSEIAKEIDTALTKRGFQQLPGATVTPEYAAMMYQKSEYHLSLSLFPTGMPGMVSVTLNNLGNVDVGQLPVPADAKPLYVMPTAASYLTENSVDEAKAETHRLLKESGWHDFGDTTVSYFMRKDGVRLQVMVMQAPAQGNKTMIQFSTEQLSSALPVPEKFKRLAYADITTTIDGDCELSEDELFDWYRKALEDRGAKATTEEPVKIDFRRFLIFRSPSHELIELECHTVNDLTRFQLSYKTAAEAQEEDQRADAATEKAMAARKTEADRLKNPEKILVPGFSTATPLKKTPQTMEFTVKSGTAKGMVSRWLTTQKASGWQVESTIDENEVGEYILKMGEKTVDLSFIDPGIIPGQITLKTTKYYQLELQK